MQPKLVVPSQLMRQMTLLKTASVAGSRDDIITIISGYAARATAASAYVVGLLSADWTNDTSNDPVQITVDEFGLYEIDSDVALVQATHVGNAYDLADHNSINPSGTTTKQVRVVGISPSGRGICAWNKNMIGSGAA